MVGRQGGGPTGPSRGRRWWSVEETAVVGEAVAVAGGGKGGGGIPDFGSWGQGGAAFRLHQHERAQRRQGHATGLSKGL